MESKGFLTWKTRLSGAWNSTSVACGGADIGRNTNSCVFRFLSFCLLPVRQHLFLCKKIVTWNTLKALIPNNKQLKGKIESFLQQKIRAKLCFQGRAFCDVLDNSNNNKGHESSAILRRDVACLDKWPLLRLRSGTSDNGDGTVMFIFGMCQRTCFWSLLFYNSQVFIYMVWSSRASPIKRSLCIWTVRTFPSPLCADGVRS